ncbi:MAG: hypothetical protein HYZ49_07955 [Chloroflexi bacterium]|nr:hypothetical protein [Chloroflexota bacterium]
MSLEATFGLGGVIFAALLILLFWFLARRSGRPPALREIEAFQNLPQKVGEAVESGKRVHVSLGSGAVGGKNTVAALAGLSVLETIAEAATISDKPPIVTSGDGVSTILAQDTLRRVYKQQNAEDLYDHLAGRLAGPTTMSYTAGVMTTLKDESVSTSLLIGSYDREVALMADAGLSQNAHQIIGTDSTQGQALAYVSGDHALIGEDMFASGAYLAGGKPAHRASLQMQDVLRLVVVAAVVGGMIAKILGLI